LGKQVGEKIEYEGQKLTNFHKKRTFQAKKNKLGLSLRGEKRIFLRLKLGKKIENNVQKLTNLKKKNFLGHKNKLGLSLSRKMFFLSKIGKKFLE